MVGSDVTENFSNFTFLDGSIIASARLKFG